MSAAPLTEREWLARQVASYTKLRPRYERYAKFLASALEAEMSHLARATIVRTRAKEIGSFAEKALRKRAQYPDPTNDFTDLCGARLIVRTRSEADILCAWVEKSFQVDEREDVAERLGPAEFGYQSVHYIVEIAPGSSLAASAPETVLGLKAELQVRTMAQHAYSDFTHDIAYKGEVELPTSLQRDVATIAAQLEIADRAFSRVEAGLRLYETSYGSYLSEDEIRDDLEILETVLAHEDNERLALRAGKLAMAVGDWARAVELMSRHVDPNAADSAHQPLLRDLGIALCKLHEAKRSAKFKLGQRYLEVASSAPHRDPDALASLAGTWREVDENKARDLYRQAYELDPPGYYALANYLECELRTRHDTTVLTPLRPVIEQAVARCRTHAEAGINLPWALFSLGELKLFVGDPYEAVLAYARGVAATTADWMLETALESIGRLSGFSDELAGYEWVRTLLLIGRAAKYPPSPSHEELVARTSPGGSPIAGPVVIVTGATACSAERRMRGHRALLVEAFADFRGTVISGGTRSGIAGLVGELGRHYERIRTLGYVPKHLPKGVRADERYSELRTTDSTDFSLAEPLQYWTDIVASGIEPAQVKALGIDGGHITAAQLRLGLALGASVGLVSDSRGTPDELLRDTEWDTSGTLIPLPPDPQTLRAFIEAGRQSLTPETRETLGRLIHDAHRGGQAPPFSGWEELPENLRESSRSQADHIVMKLERIGCEIQRVSRRQITPISFTEGEVELMAEAEHGRWNAERLAAGWRLGSKKDLKRKISPYLVPWDELPDEVKEWDRATVRRIPKFLAAVGFEVRRASR